MHRSAMTASYSTTGTSSRSSSTGPLGGEAKVAPRSRTARRNAGISRCQIGHGCVRTWHTLCLMGRIARVVTKRRLTDDDTSWGDYWRTRSVAERLAMATELSLECVRADTDQGLHRVHRVLRRT